MRVVPAGWHSTRLGRLFRRRDERGRSDLPLLSVYRELGVVPREGREDNFNRPGEDLNAYRVVEPGDLVLNKMKTWQGSLGISSHQGIVSPAYFVASQVGDADPRFLHHLLRSRPLIAEYGARSKGIRPSQWDLPWDEFKDILVWLPPIQDQRAIADFLNRQTVRLEALIARRRNLAALAVARFESVVYDAMRGAITSLDTPRKPSGLEWLGDIPEHWTTPPVGANFDVILGKMVNPEASSAAERYPYLRNTNVKWDHFDLADLETMGFSPVERVKYALRKGDLLVCEGGEVGRAAVWDQDEPDLFFQKAVHRVRARRDESTRFLMYCLRAAAKRGVFRVEGNQATIVHLTAEKLRVHRFPWPPPAEQGLIVRRLDAERDALQRLISRLDSQLSLLEEHRQALIAAAVTGQMDIPSPA